MRANIVMWVSCGVLAGACSGSNAAHSTAESSASHAGANPSKVAGAAHADIELVGRASISGTAHDLSGLKDTLSDGTPHDRLGGFGSAIAWTGKGEQYIAMVDRGSSNGDVAFECRFDRFEIHVDPVASPSVTVRLVATTMLTDEQGRNLVGLSSAFDAKDPLAGLRFDPEGVRVGPHETLFVCDEYGPFVCEFDMHGRRLRALHVPPEFAVAHPSTDKEEKVAGNMRGRVTNKGFEGLAISPDGSKLHALLQEPLIQDQGRKGVNCRLLEIDIASQRTRELCVALDEPGLDFNEILAIDDHEFLVIERDGKGGSDARFKKIMKLDIAGASDVSTIEALPAKGLPKDVRAVAKSELFDLLDPRFQLADERFPEKIEGLAFGPDLPDGRRLLLVTTDNDLRADVESWIWAFAVERKSLPAPRSEVPDAR